MSGDKIYLGISLGFNSSVCLYSEQRGIIAALSQEKINKQKNTKEIPIEAMLKCCEMTGTKEIEQIAFSHYQELTLEEIIKYTSRDYKIYAQNANSIGDFFRLVIEGHGMKLNNRYLRRIEHHTAHAFSGFGIYGMEHDKYFTVTSDGFGDGYSARITAYGFEDYAGPVTLSEVPLDASIALVYQFTTGALGFKEHQHEGKVTGLAAYGSPIYFGNFMDMFRYDLEDYGNKLSLDYDKARPLTTEEYKLVNDSKIIDFDDFLIMKNTVYSMVEGLLEGGAKREDIASSVQIFAETITLTWIYTNIRKFTQATALTDKYPAYLSGGLFANALINQKINESNLFSELYIAPAVGDEGNALGVAVYTAYIQGASIVASSLNGLVSGPTIQVSSSDIIRLPEDVKMYTIENDKAGFIADKLADKKVVCLVEGKTEFGSRALCHRSILYDATEKETNTWLNKKLGRTEFMPYAPVVLDVDASDLFANVNRARSSARFMALTFRAKPEFLDNYKAVYHVDGTARPQIINQKDNEFMYDVLSKYKAKTGKKALINTSFNMHNQPIVSSFEEALNSWLESGTDYLIVNNFVFEKKIDKFVFEKN